MNRPENRDPVPASNLWAEAEAVCRLTHLCVLAKEANEGSTSALHEARQVYKQIRQKYDATHDELWQCVLSFGDQRPEATKWFKRFAAKCAYRASALQAA